MTSTSTPASIKDNRTLQILAKAQEGGYAINAQSCYDTQSVIALIRAAEASRSPAILQLFPITMAQFGKEFVRFCIHAAHSAQVPISVHVDHAGNHEDIDRVLTFAEQGVAVDSIMIDCSHHDTDEENIEMALPYCKRAAKLGMAVEVELGRLAGGEAGVRVIEEGALTKVEKAEKFLAELGAQMLAPSIGNVHGRQPYLLPPENAQPFRIDLLQQLQDTVGPGTKSDAFLVLHGTDDVPDVLFKKCIAAGARKMNVNSWSRDPQVEYWIKKLPTDGLPEVYEGGMSEFGKSCTRFFNLLGSAGKA